MLSDNFYNRFSKKLPLELIIFDCDGVLVDSEIIGNQVIHKELLLLGYSITLEQYMQTGVGRRKEEEDEILNQMGIKKPNDFWPKVDKKILDEFTATLKPIHGVKEVLQDIKIKKCIASSSGRNRLEHSLRITHLYQQFESVIFDGDMVKKGKPDPDIFLLASKTFGISPDRCLVIEDSINGIKAAQAAGMRVWGFIGGAHCNPSYIKTIEQTGVELIFSDIKQLPQLLKQDFYSKALEKQEAMRNFLGI
ncbi:MAG: HAD family hydrolase [Parachlamydiaceae bacterium]|nr:HAD family hydrolase [Parachlamydiaceae bacterium]